MEIKQPAPVTTQSFYYVGDLCYVMHDEWDEICNLAFERDGVEGKHQLADGRKFAIYGTAYGDGTYFDSYDLDRTYSVDSGTVGIIEVKDITDPEFLCVVASGLGHVIELPQRLEDMNCGYSNGTIWFGDFAIITGFEEEEE
jgi:hypothetical protein